MTSRRILPPSGRAITTPRGGRLQIGMAEIKSESVADFSPESVAGLLRNQQDHDRDLLQRSNQDDESHYDSPR
jgi:hypothetical protein